MPAVYLFAILFIYGVLILFVFPLWKNSLQIWLCIAPGPVSILFWLRTMYADPGAIKRPKHIKFIELLKLIDPIQICVDCEIVRTPRSRHCAVCNTCVERFDHHCPWVNNCVGVGNHVAFMIFLTTTLAAVTLVFAFTVDNLMWIRVDMENDELKDGGAFLRLLDGHVYLNHANVWTSHVLVLALTALSLLFLAPLIVVQLGNFCMNKSTNERFSYRPVRARTASVATERSDSIVSSAAQTATTSMIAEQLVEDIGQAKHHVGCCSTVRNCGQFCSDSA